MITRSLSKTCGCDSCGGTSTSSSSCNACSGCNSCSACNPLWNLCRCRGCGCQNSCGSCNSCGCSCLPATPTPPAQTLPSVLSAANTTTQTVAAGASLPFALNNVLYGRDITHAAGGSAVTLSTPGLYRVDFHATASPLTTAPAGTVLEAQLNLNGSPVPGASASESFTAATDTGNLSFSTVVPVTTAPATLTVSFPTAAIVSDSGITVQRIGSLLNTPVASPYGTYPSTYSSYGSYPNYCYGGYGTYSPYPAYPSGGAYGPFPAYPL